MAARRRAASISRRLRTSRQDVAALAIKPSQLLALQAFEAAYRLGSFKETAKELNLTSSAISHRIRHLEESLGVALFTRSHRAVTPTSAGNTVAAATGRAFAELARINGASRDAAGRERLRLKVFPLFASAWLIPHLSEFGAKHPDIDLWIETSSKPVDFDLETFDAGISVSDGHYEGLDALHLADLRATPVAVPMLARRLKLKKPTDLERATLIHVTSFPAAWAQWMKSAGITGLKPARTISVDTFVAAIQAAEQGAGVALGMNLFLGESQRKGAVRRLFATDSPTGSYWLVHPPAERRHRALRIFKDWLRAELTRTTDAASRVPRA